MSLSPATIQTLETILTDIPVAIDFIGRLLDVAGISEETVIKVAGVPLPALDPVGPDVDADYQAAKKA